MTSLIATTASTSSAASSAQQPAAAEPRAGGGIQGLIGDALRGAGSGYAQATKMAGVQADKAAIHPFETVSTATGLLKEKTANIKGLSRATGLLHTIGGFAMLIMTANASGIVRQPGATASELAHKAADMIDGRETTNGFSPGWFSVPVDGGDDAGRSPEPMPESAIGSALGSLGMR